MKPTNSFRNTKKHSKNSFALSSDWEIGFSASTVIGQNFFTDGLQTTCGLSNNDLKCLSIIYSQDWTCWAFDNPYQPRSVPQKPAHWCSHRSKHLFQPEMYLCQSELTWIGRLRVASCLCFKARLRAKLLICKWFFILLQINLFSQERFFSLIWKVRVSGTRKWIISILAARNGTLDPIVARKGSCFGELKYSSFTFVIRVILQSFLLRQLLCPISLNFVSRCTETHAS